MLCGNERREMLIINNYPECCNTSKSGTQMTHQSIGLHGLKSPFKGKLVLIFNSMFPF